MKFINTNNIRSYPQENLTQSHQIHNSFGAITKTETDISLKHSDIPSNLQNIEVQNFNQSKRGHNFLTYQKYYRYNATVNKVSDNSQIADPNTVENIDISIDLQNQIQKKSYRFQNKTNNDNIIDTSPTNTIDIIKNNYKLESKTGYPYNINFKLANSLSNQLFTLENIINILLEYQNIPNNGIYHHIQNSIHQSSNC